MELIILDLATLGAVSSVALLSALGVVVLPWTDAELRDTTSAVRSIPAVLRQAVAPVGEAPPGLPSLARR